MLINGMSTFNHADKWYEHKPESVLENERSQLLWDFEVQMDLPKSLPCLFQH